MHVCGAFADAGLARLTAEVDVDAQGRATLAVSATHPGEISVEYTAWSGTDKVAWVETVDVGEQASVARAAELPAAVQELIGRASHPVLLRALARGDDGSARSAVVRIGGPDWPMVEVYADGGTVTLVEDRTIELTGDLSRFRTEPAEVTR